MSSKNIKNPAQVRLFFCMMYSHKHLKELKKALAALEKKFGRMTAKTEEYDFSSITDYYDEEHGNDLKRCIYAFSLVEPDKMPEIKLYANKLEDRLMLEDKRTINIDPGYVSITNVALMSTKNFTHRIYLRKGIYADLTLIFKKQHIQEFDWTYPDFRQDIIKEFLLKERNKLLNKGKILEKRASINMTELLYLKDCYLNEFEARITDVGDGTEILLDITAFYPTSGGQPNDTGILSSDGIEYNVVDVQKKDGNILHKVDRPGLRPNDAVKGRIDWQRRYKLMRYHTAAHMLSTMIHNETGADITGNQLYLDKARVDFSLEKFDRELMKGYEEKANNIIIQGLAVSFRLLGRDEAFKIPSLVKLRMQLPESIREIRIVDIASDNNDFDHQACGGTHLHNTSEIKGIEIFDLENKGKDRKRIYFRLKD